MKKTKLLTLMLAALCIFSMTACGTQTKKESLISIVGVFYGDCGAKNGYKDLYVVFDYKNDETNRTMPTNVTDVSITANDTNVYNPHPNTNNQHVNKRNTYNITTYGWFERYTGYKYVIGYGELLGNSAPARMFAHFNFNPNDLSGNEKIKFTVGDQTAEYDIANIQEISVMDEILKCESNYETLQMISGYKWRVDSAYRILWFIPDVRANYGEDFDGMAQSMKSLFSESSQGVSVFEAPSNGFSSKTHTYNDMIATLPSYNREKLISACPELGDKITKFEQEWIELANVLRNPNSKTSDVQKLLTSLCLTYDEMCKIWNMEPSPK